MPAARLRAASAADVLMLRTLATRGAGPMCCDRRLLGTRDGMALHPGRLARLGAVALALTASLCAAQISGIRPGSPLPDATLNHSYSVRFTPLNPFQGLPVTWSITPGCLDGSGLAFTPDGGLANTARITGVAHLRGTFFCTISAQDAGANVVAKLYQLSIVRACNAPRITSATPPSAIDPGAPFAYTVTASGKPPHTFSALGLPPGIAIDPATGLISGTTQLPGSYPVTLSVVGCGRTAIQNFTLVVGSLPVTLQLASTPDPAVFGQDITVAVHAASGTPPPSGTVLLCALASGQFCAPPAGAPPPGTPPGQIVAFSSATLDANGDAAFVLRGLEIGNYVLQGYYGGDATHGAAQSLPVDQFVIKGVVLPPQRARVGRAPVTAAEPIPALAPEALALLSLGVALIALGRARGR